MTIEVYNGKHLEYASDRPVLQVRHQINDEVLASIIAAAVAYEGAERFVVKYGHLFGQSEVRRNGPYYVFVSGGHAPTTPHGTYTNALEEAKRLALAQSHYHQG